MTCIQAAAATSRATAPECCACASVPTKPPATETSQQSRTCSPSYAQRPTRISACAPMRGRDLPSSCSILRAGRAPTAERHGREPPAAASARTPVPSTEPTLRAADRAPTARPRVPESPDAA
ncbi:hypothetical protein T484DRAFT_1957152 [Baffinella frigidus]|nr:hypothetical protein T484DRAFT_1957152 [Cryptophyta sp. CCMP2293]